MGTTCSTYRRRCSPYNGKPKRDLGIGSGWAQGGSKGEENEKFSTPRRTE